LYIPVYLYIDMFYILWVYNPLGSIEHEINWTELQGNSPSMLYT